MLTCWIEKVIRVIAPKVAELHNRADHKAFRAAFTKSAQEPGGHGHVCAIEDRLPGPAGHRGYVGMRSGEIVQPGGSQGGRVHRLAGPSSPRCSPYWVPKYGTPALEGLRSATLFLGIE